jgi:hypothetical protein
VFDSFDIFRVDADGDAVWVVSVPTLQTACKLVEQLSASEPGEYFLFGQQTGHEISVHVVEETFSTLKNVGTYTVH